LIYVHYDLGSWAKDLIHLHEAKIHLKEFTVVKNDRGQLNIDALKSIQKTKDEKETPQAEPAQKAKMPNMRIDRLELNIGKVIYKDYSKAGGPLIREFNINLREKYSDITDPARLVNLIVLRALMNTAVAQLADFDLNFLKESLNSVLGNVEKLTTTLPRKAVTGALDLLKKSADGLLKGGPSPE
jgi:hypothetical protein